MGLKWYINSVGFIFMVEATDKWPKSIKIPSTVNRTHVVGLGRALFANNLSIESIEIPASVRKIGASAFACCKNLKKVIFEEGSLLEIVENNAFENCGIESFPFEELPHLNYIGIRAFCYTNNLVKADLSANKIYNIPEACFLCSNISELHLSPETHTFRDNCFANTKIETLDFSDMKVTLTFHRGAFKCNKYLKDLKFPTVMTFMDAECFSSCQGLKSVTIPSNVSLGDYTFSKCNSLETVIFEEGYPISDFCACGIFSACKSLKNVHIHTYFTDVGSQAFLGCTALETITFPETLQIIRDNAFRGCSSIKEINLTNMDIQELENCSFTGTTFQLEDFKMDFTSATEIKEDAFENNPHISNEDLIKQYPFCRISPLLFT